MPEISQSQQVKVPLQEAQNWKKSAQAVGRSPSHLQKIEQTINNATKTQIDNKPAITLERKDALALKKDRADFQKLQVDNKQTSTEAQEVSSFKGRKR